MNIHPTDAAAASPIWPSLSMPKSSMPQTSRKPLSTTLSADPISKITHSVSRRPSLQYDLLNDFVPILALGETAFILFAKQGMPAKDLRELIG
jgi:hypothetical protein